MINGISNTNDSFLIGYVETCIGSAITIEEAHNWVYHMIEKYDDLPPYMYYLMEAEDRVEFSESIGFPSYPSLENDEYKALIGLSYVRKLTAEDGVFNISKKAAINALKRNPQVVERFKETFPFIELPDPLIPS